MKILTKAASVTCKHITGKVNLRSSQGFVTIEGKPVLRKNDFNTFPLLSINGCLNTGPTIKPCQFALWANEGYSSLVFIEGIPVCLRTLTGLTDGTPPGFIDYSVRDPGQDFVNEV